MSYANPTALFLLGATACATFVVGAFFLQYWRKTRDRFFALFAAGFWLMTVNRVVLYFLGHESEHRDVVYLSRLLAFALIIFAIVDKNRTVRRPG